MAQALGPKEPPQLGRLAASRSSTRAVRGRPTLLLQHQVLETDGLARAQQRLDRANARVVRQLHALGDGGIMPRSAIDRHQGD